MVPGIGGGELILIAVVALVVVGPKDLPKLLRQLGRFVGKMRRMADDFRTSFDDMARQSELDDLRKEVEALRTGKIQAIEDVNDQMKSIGDDINASLKPETHYYSGADDIASPDAVDFAPEVEIDAQMAGLPPKGAAEPAAPKPRRARAKKATTIVADATPPAAPAKKTRAKKVKSDPTSSAT